MDISVIKKDEKVILRIREDCYIFDPVNQNRLCHDEDKVHHIGLRMIFGTAKEIRYTTLLKLNNLVIHV